MTPVIALVGRPNVGKSTLFNRLTHSRNALVANYAGLTRDRQYGDVIFNDRHFVVIDTGGITGDEAGIDYKMAEQSMLAISESDLVMLLMDAREGLLPGDLYIIDHLRRQQKPVFLLVNKVDGLDIDIAMADFFSLGFEHLHAISASQGRGITSLMETVLTVLPEEQTEEEAAEEGAETSDTERSIKIAIAGRPNVGKSTLVNRMLGEQRVVVYDQPGTTRDSVRIPFERRGRHYTLIDTAGIRRRGKTKETVEKFSVVKSLQSIADADVVILVMDARDGIVEQDLHLISYALEAGSALVLALNKWDGMGEYERDQVHKAIQRRLGFVDFARIHFISALHGTGVGNLYQSVEKAWSSASRQLVTNQLTRILEDAIREHAPPMNNGRRIRLRYAHAGGQKPPLIVIHGKQTDKLPLSYTRYLEKSFREALKLEGTPIRIELRSDDNPFTRDEESLNQRQVARKRRIRKNREEARK